MFFNEPILSKPKQSDLSIALEALLDDSKQQDYSIRNKYYPLVASFLPKTEKILFKHISQYRDRNIDILSTPYPIRRPLWTPDDEQILFRCTNIDNRELEKSIREVRLPEGVTEKKNFKPVPTVMLLIMRYYALSKQEEKLKIMYSYMAYSMYWSIFEKYFKFPPEEAVMVYTINNLSNKYKLKQFSSMDELLYYIIETTMNKYREMLERSSDSDIWYIIGQVKTRLNNSFKKIVNEYLTNRKNKEIMFKSTEFIDDEGTQRIDSSVSASVESLANSYTSAFFASPPDMARVRMAAQLAGVSASELRATLNVITQDEAIDEVKTFYESLFYIYLTSGDPNANLNTIKSPKFLSVMRSVFKKGNSTDKNIVITRELMNKWLEKGSNTYRATKRRATMNDYRLAVYYYFILSVTSNK